VGGGEVSARRPWSDQDIALLKASFPERRTDELAAELGRPYGAVAQKAAALGLRKSAAYLASPDAHRLDGKKGMGTRFAKGQQAWNKGTNYQPGGRARETQFKPGRPAHAAHNYQPIGALRINADGYLEIKVTDDPAILPARRWVAVHRAVWIAANGEVPPGHVVVFRPGRHSTAVDEITLDAVELVTRCELMLRNTVHRYGPEVAKLIQLRGALNRQINKRSKGEA